jgi:hypothetical protein
METTNSVDMASWNRERTTTELRFFVEQHHATLPVDIDLE